MWQVSLVEMPGLVPVVGLLGSTGLDGNPSKGLGVTTQDHTRAGCGRWRVAFAFHLHSHPSCHCSLLGKPRCP